MDLKELAYIIDGSVGVKELLTKGPDSEPIFEAVLFDSQQRACVVQFPDKPQSETRAQGWYREQTALDALAQLLAGNTVGVCWPPSRTDYLALLRVPTTLVAGTEA